jgi:hypothetical protein
MEMRHSGFGIASFVMSILVGIAIFLLVVVAGVMESSTPGGIDEESAGAIVLGLLILACGAADLLALGLGIGGMFQANRKRIFAVFGIVFSALTILGTIALIIIGNMMG